MFCHYGQCHYTKLDYVECSCDECDYAERHYAEWHSVKCLYRQEEWPVSEIVLKAKSPNLPKWTVNKIFIVLFTMLL